MLISVSALRVLGELLLACMPAIRTEYVNSVLFIEIHKAVCRTYHLRLFYLLESDVMRFY